MNLRALTAWAWMGCCLLLAAPFSAASQANPPPASVQPAAGAQSAQSPAESYILGPDDVIEVEVLGSGDFKARVKIAADGTVQLPYLGSVVAANRTALQLRDDLAKALESGGYFTHPILSVEIVGYASRYVTVLGNVGTPGLIPIDRPYRLSDILARVGGVKDSGADYVIVTSDDGTQRNISIRTLATGVASEDPFIQPGAKIFSPPGDLFYISGEVKAPGAYPLVSGMTLRMALSRGGGVTDLGTDRAVKVTRAGKTITRADLDSPVEAGDVIVVPERLF